MVEEILKDLEDNLTVYRFRHIISVCEVAIQIARIYDLPKDKVELAALLHDSTKEFSNEWQYQTLLNINETDQQLLDIIPIQHAKTGRVYAEKKFGITDNQILSAIEYHTTAHPDMDEIAMAVYISDYIEPNRSFKFLNEVIKLVGVKSLAEITYIIAENEIEYYKEVNKIPHINTINYVKKYQELYKI